MLSNKKSQRRKGKVQLINANEKCEKRRKSLGNKRNNIPMKYIEEITHMYGNFEENEISKIFDNTEFGYLKIVVERPLIDDNGEIVLKKGKKQADILLRDTVNVPLKENIEDYFAKEVLAFSPDAWIDESKTKIGYEIPFSRYFYKYDQMRPSFEIMTEILELEKKIAGNLDNIFRI